MSIKRTILLVTASIAIGFALTPVQAQTANNPGSSAAPKLADDGAGLPLPTPPDWLTRPRPKAGPVNDCDSIMKRIAQLQADQLSYQAASAKAAAESQQESKQADAAKDTWQKEETLWKSSSHAAQDASNPGDKKLLLDAASKHWWNSNTAKRDYEFLKQRSEQDADHSRLMLKMVTFAQREIDELNAKLQAACAEKKVAGNNDGSGYQHGVGPNVPLGGRDAYRTINLPLGDGPSTNNADNQDKRPEAPSKTPVLKQELPKKVSALPSETAPLGNQEQNSSAPNFRAYFAAQAKAAGGFVPAARSTLQNTAVSMSVPGPTLRPAATAESTPSSRMIANATIPTMTAVMPVRVEDAASPTATQAVPQNPAVAMPTNQTRETAAIRSTMMNGSAVSNISTRVGAFTVTRH